VIFSTGVILLLVPATYLIFDDVARLFRGRREVRAEVAGLPG
jgi:hypothetical protein